MMREAVSLTSPTPFVAAQRPVSASVALLRALAARGVRAAFGIPGGSASPVFDALVEVPEIVFTPTKHEAIAGFAAMGHARATGLPALVLTTSGPGITNAMTGIAAAFLEELPIIAIAGDVAQGAMARGALQDGSAAGLDVLGVLRSVTRWTAALSSAQSAPAVALRAWQVATGVRPGPVFIDVPLDVGSATAQPNVIAAMATPTPMPDAAACREAASLLANARRPLLVLGNGARAATVEARALAERLGLAVCTTGHAKGTFPESHPLHLGLIGVGQHPTVAEYLADPPDVTCIVGSRLGDLATNGWRLKLAGTVATVQVDREPWLIGRNVPVTLGIVGDARLALSQMLSALPTDVAVPRRQSTGPRSIRAELESSDSIPLKPQRVLSELTNTFPEAVWCSDIGEHLTMALHYLRIDEADRFNVMAGLGSMGSGIGFAIGTKLARPDRTVIALCGDGSFAMHAGEILTCVENRVGVIFAVFNDGRWNMIHHGFSTVYGRVPPNMPSNVADLAAVAEGFGAIGLRVDSPGDLAPARLRRALASGRPVVLDIRIDPGESLTADGRAAAIRHFAHGGAG